MFFKEQKNKFRFLKNIKNKKNTVPAMNTLNQNRVQCHVWIQENEQISEGTRFNQMT